MITNIKKTRLFTDIRNPNIRYNASMTSTNDETNFLFSFRVVSGARWHVFLNPYSGTKKSKKVWDQFSRWLSVAGVKVTLTETEYAGHCQVVVSELDFKEIDVIVSISGDGMLHELINGIMKRKDWHEAASKPIGVIPAGTGNALAASLMYPTPIMAFLALIKRQWKPFDLMAVYQYTPVDSQPPTAPSSSSSTITSGTTEEAPAQAQEGEKPKTLKKSKSSKISDPTHPTPSNNASSSPSARTTKNSSIESSETPSSNGGTAPKISSPRSSSSSSLKNSSSKGSSSKLLTKAAAARQSNQSETEPGTWNLVCYSFEALMWGFVSDVDIETEPWRWMGDFRYTLGSIVRIAALRHYPARLLTLDSINAGDHMSTCQFHRVCDSCADGTRVHYERYEKLEKRFGNCETISQKTTIDEMGISRHHHGNTDEETLTIATHTIEVTEKAPRKKRTKKIILVESPPDEEPPSSKGNEIVEKVKENLEEEKEPDTTRSETAGTMSSSPDAIIEDEPKSPSKSKRRRKKKTEAQEDEETFDQETKKKTREGEKIEMAELASEDRVEENIGETKKIKYMRGLADGLENVIDFDPMAEKGAESSGNVWSEVESKFVYFVASNVTHIATDLRVAPFAHTCGGTVDIVYAADMAKLAMLEIMTSIENGRYIEHSDVTYKKVNAFVLIPLTKPGVMDLDGEEYNAGPTAIEVHAGVLRMCVAIWDLSLDPHSVV